MKMSVRLWLLIGIAMIGLAGLGGSSLWTLRNSMRDGRKSEITNMLDSARNLVSYYARQEQQGVLTHAQAQRAALETLARLANAPKTYYIVRSPDGMLFEHPDPKLVGTVSLGKTLDGRTDYDAWRDAMGSNGVSIISVAYKKPGESGFSEKLNGMTEFKPWNWWIATGFFTDDMDADFYGAARETLVALMIIAALLLCMGHRLIRNVQSAIGGEPRDVADVACRIALGDLSDASATRGSMEGNSPSHDSSIASSVLRMSDNLRAMLRKIHHATESISAGTKELRQGNDDLSHRSGQQAAALQQTAASVEELTATVKQNAESVVHATDLARVAVKEVSTADDYIHQIVAGMSKIAGSAQRMRDFVSVVSAISAQTNILALNAAVEAARAGVEGRGFAVVASEVRELARRASESVRTISGLIDEALVNVESGNGMVQSAREGMASLVQHIKGIESNLSQISQASAEQSRGISQVSEAISYIDEATQRNTNVVLQVAEAAASLDAQVRSLSEAVGIFRLG